MWYYLTYGHLQHNEFGKHVSFQWVINAYKMHLKCSAMLCQQTALQTSQHREGQWGGGGKHNY